MWQACLLLWQKQICRGWGCLTLLNARVSGGSMSHKQAGLSYCKHFLSLLAGGCLPGPAVRLRADPPAQNRPQVNLEDVHAAQAAALASVADALQAGLASGKRAAAHAPAGKPQAAKRARGALPLPDDALSSGESDSGGDSDDGLTYPRPRSAVPAAAMGTFQPQRPVASGLSDSCVAVIAAPGAAGDAGGSTSSSGSEQQALPARIVPAADAGAGDAAPAAEQQASNLPPAEALVPRAASAGMSSAAGAAPVEVEGSAPEPRAFPPVDLEAYAGPAALEALGLERLKAELARRGLKCGGALRERGARLWLLRHTPRARLDRKHLAKPAPGAA